MKLNKKITLLKKSLALVLKNKSIFSKSISILGIILSFLPIVTIKLIQVFSNNLEAVSSNGSFNEFITSKTLIVQFFFISFLFFIQLSYETMQNIISKIDSININKYIKKEIIRYSCEIKYKYIDNFDGFKEKIEFINSYAGNKVARSLNNLLFLLQEIITFLSICIALYIVDKKLVLIILIAYVPTIIISYSYKDKDYKHKLKWMKESALIIHYFFVCTSERTLLEVKCLNIYPYLKQKWQTLGVIYLEIKNKLLKKYLSINILTEILKNFVYMIILYIIVKQIFFSPELGIGTFIVSFSMINKFQKTTERLFSILIDLKTDIYYINDFFFLETLEFDSEENKEAVIENTNIEFIDVNFKYSNHNTSFILNDLNIKIREGEKIAIVGENGSGKSTFLSLLCGFYNPTTGIIKIGNFNINNNENKIRSLISTVFQNFCQYDSTILDNITLSNFQKNDDLPRLTKIMEALEINKLISFLPYGLNEKIGSFSKNGFSLSKGQWQKIAIARALFKKKYKILILDEPTSSLDPSSEIRLYKKIFNFTKDKTILIVSHRLGVTKFVDRILVFKDGKIVEDGSHDELFKKNGIYKKMYITQSQLYK